MFEISSVQQEELEKIEEVLFLILEKKTSFWQVFCDSIKSHSALEGLRKDKKEFPKHRKVIEQLASFSALSLSLVRLNCEYQLDIVKLKQPKNNDLIIYFALLILLSSVNPVLKEWLNIILLILLLLVTIKFYKTLKFWQQSAVLEKTIFLIKQAQDRAKVK